MVCTDSIWVNLEMCIIYQSANAMFIRSQKNIYALALREINNNNNTDFEESPKIERI